MWNPQSRLLFLAFVSLLVPVAADAQPEVWTIDPGHSAATFQVRHMVIANVKGEFAGPVGSATFDPKNLSTLLIEATIDARTINTRNADRDKDLRSNLFFDVGKYPKITFKSRSVAIEAPDLFAADRQQADILMVAMKAWVGTHRTDANGGVDPAAVTDFEKWIREREGLAKQTRLMAVASRPAGW